MAGSVIISGARTPIGKLAGGVTNMGIGAFQGAADPKLFDANASKGQGAMSGMWQNAASSFGTGQGGGQGGGQGDEASRISSMIQKFSGSGSTGAIDRLIDDLASRQKKQ